eukprot:jgi/Galph1/2330/GphlegSOOS_G1007.1
MGRQDPPLLKQPKLPTTLEIIDATEDTQERCRQVIKTLFDYQSTPHTPKILGPLQPYISKVSCLFRMFSVSNDSAKGFEVEQVWEQLQLRNRPLLKFIRKRLNDLEKCRDEEEVQAVIDNEKPNQADDDDIANQVDAEALLERQREGKESSDVDKKTTEEPVSNLEEDIFFSYDTLNKIAENESLESEKAEQDEHSDSEESDSSWQDALYEDLEQSDQNYDYERFFDSVKNELKHKSKNNSEQRIEDDPVEKRIKELEEKLIEKKHWSMLGEVTASQRPVDSALDIDLDFDTTMKQSTQKSENNGSTLEDKIRQRIAEEAYDEVIRFQSNEPTKPKQVVDNISQEQDRRGLSEIYEKEYLQSIKSAEEQKQSQYDEKYREIDELFEELSRKLDALSNFHFNPRPKPPEMKVIPSNLPSIVAEEAVPDVIGDGTLLAPEEVYKPRRGQVENGILGSTEVSQTDRKRMRRRRKRAGKREKLRKSWEAKVHSQVGEEKSVKRQKKDAMKTLEALRKSSNNISIGGMKKQKTSKNNVAVPNQKVSSAALKL